MTKTKLKRIRRKQLNFYLISIQEKPFNAKTQRENPQFSNHFIFVIIKYIQQKLLCKLSFKKVTWKSISKGTINRDKPDCAEITKSPQIRGLTQWLISCSCRMARVEQSESFPTCSYSETGIIFYLSYKNLNYGLKSGIGLYPEKFQYCYLNSSLGMQYRLKIF